MATFSNQATLTYNGTTTTSNIAYGEILDVLSTAKTAVEGSYNPGDVVTYVVNLRNTGNTALTGLTLTDDLGGYTFGTGTVYPLTYQENTARLIVNGVVQATPTVTVGPPMTVTGINIPAGGNGVLVYQAVANSYANPDVTGTIVNTATITGGGLTTPIVATATLGTDTEPSIAINKAISPTVVADNDQVTYTFTLQNTGNTPLEAADNAAVTDTFNPILTGLTVTYEGTTWTPGTQYTYNEVTGLFSTTPGLITIPAATYTQDPVTGEYTVTPGSVTLTVTGTI